MFVQLHLIKELEVGGERWTSFFNRVWPFYEKWFLSEGYTKRAGYLTSYNELNTHMPELTPVYEELCDSIGGNDIKSRFLSMYCPPPYLSGCSQIAWTKDNPTLIRNYDYHPRFFDGVVLYSNFLKPVIGMTDCTWGLLDGINADGLAVSLTFGGSKALGVGFGVPIIVRYILETCSTTDEAVSKIKTIPTHMAYNLTILDANKNFKTVYLTPNTTPRVLENNIATNHQEQLDWSEYTQFTKTVERKEYLDQCFMDTSINTEQMLALFLKPPLYHTDYEKSFGTLYTSTYRTDTKQMSLVWPRKQIELDFKNFENKKVQVNLKHVIPKHI